MTHNDTPTRWFSDALVNQLHKVDEAETKDRGRLRYDLYESVDQISIVIQIYYATHWDKGPHLRSLT